jgi:hypothetical protein
MTYVSGYYLVIQIMYVGMPPVLLLHQLGWCSGNITLEFARCLI